MLQLPTCFCFTQTLDGLILPVYNHGFFFLQREVEDVIFCLQPCLLCLTKRQATVHPPSLFSPSVPHSFLSLSLSPVHRQAVSAEAGTMSTPTNPEVKELSPVDFIQLQQYIECEYRQAGGRAGRQLSQRLTSTTTTPPLHFHFHPHTHTHSLMVSHS